MRVGERREGGEEEGRERGGDGRERGRDGREEERRGGKEGGGEEGKEGGREEGREGGRRGWEGGGEEGRRDEREEEGGKEGGKEIACLDLHASMGLAMIWWHACSKCHSKKYARLDSCKENATSTAIA